MSTTMIKNTCNLFMACCCLWMVTSTAFGKSWLKSARFKPDQHVVYKTIDDLSLDLHVFYPGGSKPADPKPAIVFFHGGGFSKGDPGAFYYACDYFASRGMVAISVRYRLNNNNIECLRDAKSAMRYIYKEASSFGIDPANVVAAGGSAGGCLAVALSTSKRISEDTDDLSISPAPAALVLFNPVYTSKGAMKEPQELRDDFTPMDNIHSNMAPALVLFGEHDKFVKVPTMKEFQQKMLDVGVRSELEIYAGEAHAFFNNSKDWVVATLRRADVFLTSLGFMQGEPTIAAWADQQK